MPPNPGAVCPFRNRFGVPVEPGAHHGRGDAVGGSELGHGSETAPCGSSADLDIDWMKKRTYRTSRALPVMMAQLTVASWETIFHRTMMMARGTCSPAEYQRMVMEKAAAMQTSTRALVSRKGGGAVLAPFLWRARGNAKRLRRKT